MTLCDASALIALLSVDDDYHQPCLDALPYLDAPLVTTWPCFVEAMYLLGRDTGWPGQAELWRYVEDEDLELYQLTHTACLRMCHLMETDRNVPMDLADASLVVAAETLQQNRIFTLDKDFYIYRLPGNREFDVVPRL